MSETSDNILEGYASVFGNRDDKGDIVAKGCFRRNLELKKQIPVLWCHDSAQPIGIVISLKEDDVGLFCRLLLFDDIPKAKEVLSISEKMSLGLSIGFRTVASEHDATFSELRTVTDVVLIEISVVTIPANPLCYMLKKEKE